MHTTFTFSMGVASNHINDEPWNLALCLYGRMQSYTFSQTVKSGHYMFNVCTTIYTVVLLDEQGNLTCVTGIEDTALREIYIRQCI